MTAVNNVKEKSWTVLNRENMRFITGLIIYLKTASACWWLKSTKVEVRRYPLKKSSFKPQCKLLGGLPTVTYSSRNVLSFVTNMRHIICLVQFRFFESGCIMQFFDAWTTVLGRRRLSNGIILWLIGFELIFLNILWGRSVPP